MTKLNLLLLGAVIASAMMLVRSAYDSRRIFADLHRAEVEAAGLAGETKRLLAEREAQATGLRVERTAREKLAMRTVTPAITVYVVDPAAAQGNAGSPRVASTPTGGGPGAARPWGHSEAAQ